MVTVSGEGKDSRVCSYLLLYVATTAPPVGDPGAHNFSQMHRMEQSPEVSAVSE